MTVACNRKSAGAKIAKPAGRRHPADALWCLLVAACCIKVSRLENCQDLIIDERTRLAIDDPKATDSIARALFVLKEAIDGGPQGVKEASDALLSIIGSAYLHTDAHGAALKLYLLPLTGHPKPQDEPVRLISGAIERGTARVRLARKGRATKTRR